MHGRRARRTDRTVPCPLPPPHHPARPLSPPAHLRLGRRTPQRPQSRPARRLPRHGQPVVPLARRGGRTPHGDGLSLPEPRLRQHLETGVPLRLPARSAARSGCRGNLSTKRCWLSEVYRKRICRRCAVTVSEAPPSSATSGHASARRPDTAEILRRFRRLLQAAR